MGQLCTAAMGLWSVCVTTFNAWLLSGKCHPCRMQAQLWWQAAQSWGGPGTSCLSGIPLMSDTDGGPVPIHALLLGDEAMLLGDHLLSLTKGNIFQENILMSSIF